MSSKFLPQTIKVNGDILTNAGSLTSETLNVSGTIDSTDISNGSLVILGGIGVAKNVNIGGNLNITGNTNSATYSSNDIPSQLVKTVLGGANNYCVGNSAGNSLTTGQNNFIVGTTAGKFLNTGSFNVFLGEESGKNNVSGSDNVHVGNRSGIESRGSDNTFIGGSAGEGWGAQTVGNQNTGIGNKSMWSLKGGIENTGVGYRAGDTFEDGTGCTFLGSKSNVKNPDLGGNYRVGVGYLSLVDEDNHCVFGSEAPATSITVIKPGIDNNTDLGTTSKRFKDLHLNNSILLSNATNNTAISYTGIEDKTLDLKQISTAVSQVGAIVPPTLTVASETPNTEWYVQSSSVLAGGNDTYYAFDGIINDIVWSADIYFPTGTAIGDRRYDWSTGIYNTVHPNSVSTVYDGGSVYYGEWIQFRIPDSYPDIQISQYDISRRIIAGLTRATPSIWQLFSSVDGLVWTAEGAEVNTSWGEYNIEPTKTIVLSNPTSPGRYFRIAIRQCGVGGIGDKKVPQISELSFTALAGCPANGCLDLTALVKVSDGVDITGNLTAYAGLFSNVLSVATVLQDTQKSAFAYVSMINKVSPPSLLIPSPIGNILFNTFDPLREKSFNMTTSVSGITAQVNGVYRIDVATSCSADSNGSYDLCIFVDGVCSASTASSDLKDTDNNKSLFLIVDLNVNSVVEVRFADATASINVAVDQISMICQRLLVST